MDERHAPVTEAPRACPFIAFDDDRDRRSDVPDHRHRCFAEPTPATRAMAHQQAYCLSSAFPTCPIFLDWARREAAAVVPSGQAAGRTAAAAAAAGLGDWASPPHWLQDAPERAAEAAPEPGQPEPPADEDDVVAPSFLTARSRAAEPAPPIPSAPVPRPAQPDPDAGLFGNAPDRSRPWTAAEEEAEEGDDDWGRERGAPGVVPVPTPGRRSAQVHQRSGQRATDAETPSWERPRRMEAYPTLRTRMGMPQVPPAALAAVALVVAALLLFFVVPGLLFPKSSNTADHTTPPPSASASAATTTPKPSIAAPTPQIYTVQSGDTFSGIAAKFGLTQAQLQAANPQIKDPNKLQIGDKITIPATSPTAIPNATAPSSLTTAP